MTLDVQFLTMVVMAISGVYLGAALETFHRFQPSWKSNRFLLYFMEIAFWLSQVLLLFYVLFRVNSGELRVYVFLALFLGFSAYKALIAPLYKRLLEIIIRIIVMCYRFLENVIKTLLIKPIKYVIQFIITLLLFAGQVIISIVRFVGKIVFYPIKWVLSLIYRMLPKSIQNFFYKTAGFYSTIKNICKKGLEYLKFKRR
ncbi:spore cortex biosynthesis protein YabQ [Lentibacillus sp. N15]|uniref:spore cortex biosynthesis protein YabQ n=1 Tax=Lentibacillus songyuanensis TaxID=3136161 RepID=UPI0031BB96FF